ncbi:hypothetical protein [Lysinibacillus sp. G4S2]|uniref:hypothetical protein n=1 Tax=Lysinibacillus sp. G4S2 TaxID=3055859 RepID=UPI0025A12BF3|nr:hypothetical protein [Lysinibacillus sp. G4S2]MDM5249868.1 hypothetical protein [Lysinibacillus sp. G4S2]
MRLSFVLEILSVALKSIRRSDISIRRFSNSIRRSDMSILRSGNSIRCPEIYPSLRQFYPSL